jgi:plastocyanin
VTWTNNDSVAHTVTGTDFASSQLAPGSTFSHKFTTAGSFDYHCSIHPSMTGNVTVQ